MAGKIIGIGGIFFKAQDAPAMRAWYHQHLGIDAGEYGATFPWRAKDNPEREHVTAWSIFPSTTKYMDPSTASFMVNYIVEGLDDLLVTLAAQGVSIDPKREDQDYGRFAWIYDPDGNKIELWEPPSPAAA